MDSKKKIKDSEYNEKKQRIENTVSLLYEKILDGQQLPKLSKATTEALLVGVYCNLDTLREEPKRQLRVKYKELRSNDNFSIASLSEGVAATDKVKTRIATAIEIFS